MGSWFLIDRVGRRNLMLYGTALITLILILIGTLAAIATPNCIKDAIGFFLLYNFFYSVTIGATAYSAITETANSRLRVNTASIGLALQNAVFTMLAFVIPYIFNPDQGNLGAKTAFIFGGLGVICCTYIFFCHPEVSGRTYEEIDEMFIKRVPARKFKTFQTENLENLAHETARN
ncbi:hypothetical protein BFJ69_g7859 [Fusarium oxysporum]|uniref:Major facilitator superfamily (MFS) profile domain-containing protein n=1 Tax=Fusarium oxysporum TaxID=5507 RepID=A0A420N4T3_FUSOX|nr:hypothetical protein BFJ69_g7859 [Fusarium oxysporum]